MEGTTTVTSRQHVLSLAANGLRPLRVLRTLSVETANIALLTMVGPRDGQDILQNRRVNSKVHHLVYILKRKEQVRGREARESDNK